MSDGQVSDPRVNFESSLDTYLKGEPLSDELRLLRQGLEPQAEAREAHQVRDPWSDKPTSHEDRLLLRDLTNEPGWPILLRILAQLAEKKQLAATGQSLMLALTDGKAVADVWLYVALYKRVLIEIQTEVAAEIAKATEEMKRK